MGTVVLSAKATGDYQDILNFYGSWTNSALANAKVTTIVEGLDKIADDPNLNLRDDRLPSDLYYWYASDFDYKVYFRRFTPNSIYVHRIWPTRRRPLKPKDII